MIPKLSKRLRCIASLVAPYRYVIDIGTDHALVPIYLSKKGLITHANASDVNTGPLDEAIKNIKHYNLEAQITIKKGNGLEVISDYDKCDVIIIAGMGGKLITDILAKGKAKLKTNKRLILQPNVAESEIRLWLKSNNYQITNEVIVKEDSKFYEIIVSEKSDNVNYTDEEIKFGPVLLQIKTKYFIEKWTEILNLRINTYLKIPHNHPNKIDFQKEINQIKTVLKDVH
mgnify:FL=1